MLRTAEGAWRRFAQRREEARVPTLTFSSLAEVMAREPYHDLSISITCVKGGGIIIPIGRANFDLHEPTINEHLHHGDKVFVTGFADHPIVSENHLLGFTPKRQFNFRLV